MTAANRTRALELVLAHEGGFVNHPRDPGGATNLGVTQRVYDAFRRSGGDGPRSVRLVTMAEAQEIYRDQYWDAVHGDDMPAGIDYAVFDYGVNSGPGKAIRDLQREVGVAPDGKFGLLTLDALAKAADADELGLISRLQARRLRYLKTLKTWDAFGRGWARRVAEVEALARDMAKGDLAYPIPKAKIPDAIGTAPGEAKAPPKATPADVAASKTPIGKGGIITAAGGAAGTAKLVADTVSRTGDTVKDHVGDGFIGHAAVLVILVALAVGLAVIGYHVWIKLEEQKGVKRPATLVGFLASLVTGGGGLAPAAA